VGPAEEIEPRLHQLTAATLSEPSHKLVGEVGVCVATRAAPSRRAANSKSLLVKVPEGLDADTSLLEVCCGSGARKAMGTDWPWVVATQKPPRP